MDAGQVVLVALQAAVKVFLVVLVGVALTRYGLLPPQLQKGVSTLVVYVFTPALLFVKVAEVISPQRLLNWWPLVVFVVLFVLMAFVVGWLLAFVLGMGSAHRNFVISAFAFRNTQSIPLALMMELAVGLPILLMDDRDTPEDVANRGEAYILFITALVNVLRWTVGSRLMDHKYAGAKPLKLSTGQDDAEDAGAPQDNAGNGEHIEIRRLTPERAELHDRLVRGLSFEFLYIDADEAEMMMSETRGLLEEQEGEGDAATCLRRMWHRLKRFVHKLSPPVVAIVLALFVGLIPPLQALFFGDNAPLRSTVTSALNAFADCAVPSTLLVLGGQLSKGPQHGNASGSAGKDDMRPVGYVAVLFLTLVGSLLAWIPLVQLLAWAAPGSLIRMDLTMRLVLMLESAMPAAVNLLTLASLNGFLEQTVANVLFYSYTLSAITLTGATVLIVIVLESYPMA